MSIRECDIAVIGGGLGGVAAALRACRWGRTVVLTEETPWLGGQATAQGVSALDEHDHIETCGAPATYYEWRDGIRDLYRGRYRLSEQAEQAPFFNPGDGWVSRLCFEPRVGVAALVALLVPEVEAGRLAILYRTRPVGVSRQGDRLASVTVEAEGGARHEIRAEIVIDATELGDLLPLAGVDWVTGAEAKAQTGEPRARDDGPAPHLTQTYTVPFVVDVRPGQDHTIPRPPGYERMRDEQPFTLTMTYAAPGGGTRDLTYKVFEPVDELPGAFWTYRRILAASQFEAGAVAGDLAMINWAGNDFKGGDFVGASPRERADLIAAAKDLSRGLLYWLQTEVPRDDGKGRGYPELRLRTDILGTEDGMSMVPYVREARRILARTTPRQQDVSAEHNPGPRAAPFADSCGVGWYPIDIHGVPGDAAATGPTKPFQLPLGALIPRAGADNLLAAAKNIGTTHMTNGCYRLHPIEWNAGEAAGALAAFALDCGCAPAAVHAEPEALHRLQHRLADAGVQLYWYTDVPRAHEAFAATQWLAAKQVWTGTDEDLRFGPDEILADADRERLLSDTGVGADALPAATSRATAARALAERLA